MKTVTISAALAKQAATEVFYARQGLIRARKDIPGMTDEQFEAENKRLLNLHRRLRAAIRAAA